MEFKKSILVFTECFLDKISTTEDYDNTGCKGRHQNSPQQDDKIIGNLFVICMRQVTKSHLYHLFMYRQRVKSIS